MIAGEQQRVTFEILSSSSHFFKKKTEDVMQDYNLAAALSDFRVDVSPLCSRLRDYRGTMRLLEKRDQVLLSSFSGMDEQVLKV